ncbi:DDE-type integrase/transposase/recombinase [Alteromonas oceani]|uniref:DDE-type integrase/transposase/recombinase n=1 Tax=Alteromonas oceani TaxID=2071609 RepID=A0ABV7JRD7_9ALTE|nr:DDE-type integrase/transposase/recombinase [Alteromonas oceani]
MYEGLQIVNQNEGINYFICAIDKWSDRVAVIDVNHLENPKNNNVKKPKIWTFDTFNSFKNRKGTEIQRYVMPIELDMTDLQILKKRNQTWIDFREKRVKKIKSLLNDECVNEYLFGDGIAEKIEQLIEQGHEWKSEGAFYNAFNKYIAFGCVENAFLPFGFKNCGSNYHHVITLKDANIKRGRKSGKLDKQSKGRQKTVSKHRGVTDVDKQNMFRLYSYFKRHNLRYKPAYALRVYQREFEVVIEVVETPNGTIECVRALPPEECISDGMFYRHWRILIKHEDLMRLKYGDIAYDKDWKPRFERARDGVIGPSFRYEIDATIADIYIRYSYDTTGRWSVGRPVIYFVVDVYTTMIVGYYIGFHGPDWIGASEAMVNACLPKAEHCAKYGITLKENEWPCFHIPSQLTADNGSEYSLKHLEPMLKANLRLRTVNFVPVYRGDCKSIVERRFGIVQDMTINFVAGATVDLKREEQHPSNKAIYTIDALHSIIIKDILHHNNTSNRVHLLNKRDAKNSIGFTPRELWLGNIDEEMNGGNPVLTEYDRMHVRWAFLLKDQASVRDGSIHFRGLEYDSGYAHEQKWYIRAKQHGVFKITVGWTRASGNFLIFRTDDGSYVELTLKRDDHCERFADESWDMIFHRLYEELQESYGLGQIERDERIKKEHELKKLTAQQFEAMRDAPENTRRSIQPGIRARQNIQRQIDMLEVSSNIQGAFKGSSPSQSTTKQPQKTSDIDRSLYDAD